MYRAYWGIPRTLKTKAGEQSNTSFGMASMLLAILAHEQPDAMLLCFDEGNETFRHQAADDYKDGRAETPDDFYSQIPRVMELMDAFTFCSVSNPQYEADDFLCTYARKAEEQGMRVTIVTGDRDALQIATENIRIAIPHKGYQQAEYLGPEEIIAKYGIRPDQVSSYKGLVGDSSDNLPGVLGIGPKTASKLLQEYDTLTGVYEHLEDIKEGVREKLERDKDQAFFCQKMAELVGDISLPHTLEELALTDVDPQHLLTFFQEMEFTLLAKRLLSFLQTDYARAHYLATAVESAVTSEKHSEESQLSLFS